MKMMKQRWTRLAAASIALGLTACGGSGGSDEPQAEETRAHDSRVFTALTPDAKTFAALAAANDPVDLSTTSRWAGLMPSGAAYRVEVPQNWNGKLVMFAHGYAGVGDKLVAQDPPIRRHLLRNGYAWAASSYTKNFYDVRAGIEDTNDLALAFNTIAAANSRTLAKPSRVYIIGTSMGGHVAAAAVEAEALRTTNHKMKYDAAMPMCGPVGDTELFNIMAGMQMSAQAMTGYANTPMAQWHTIADKVIPALFSTYPATPGLGVPMAMTSPLGMQYASVIKNLTGGERPMFAQALAFGGSLSLPFGSLGSDGTIDGILNKNVLDTTRLSYVIDGNPEATAQLNAAVQKVTAAPDANRLRRDGLRWIPQVNGEFSVPVVSIHTLGDLYVPFGMQQLYRKRAQAHGNDRLLVQRVMRGVSHCDFTVAEMTESFDALVKWESDGVKPAGDDVLTPATVAAPTYGCTYTRAAEQGEPAAALRNPAASLAPCPAG